VVLLVETAITVNVEAPFVVPVYAVVDVLFAPQLVNAMARTTIVMHRPNASLCPGARRQ